MDRKLKVGIIGLGLGRHHLAGYASNDQVEIIGVADLDDNRLHEAQSEYEIPETCHAYEDLLTLGPDLVSVALPNFLHAPATVAALDAGVHVLCEKPMAVSVAEAQKMVDAAKRNDRYLMIALNNRFRAESQILKKLIDQGELGEIYYAKTGWLRRRGIPGAGGWFTTKAKSGGGPLIDLGVHMIDLTRWLMGNPKPVTVQGSVYSKFAHTVEDGHYDVEDLAVGFIRLEGGATLIAEASWATNVPQESSYVKLMGTKGGAEITGDKLTVFTEMHDELVDITPIFHGHSWGDCIASEIAHLVTCIQEGKEPMSTGEQGLEMMKILEGIYQSAEQGSTIEIG
ncbi:MAG: Gfo/Idh/MocA family oxidoreductase [Candidatus Latescibacteria bacterium]|jgi:predicted dehydrogenase|nr:Gfo/Idh/MocA family oxidoreductase [Candidatus Latescibacterota bacterium]